MEYIELVKFDGRRRIIKSRLEKSSNQPRKKFQADWKKSQSIYNDKRNIERNIEINKKEIIKEKRYFEDDNLNDLFKDFLSMRKKIKAVNSDRAITLLINKLSKYDDKTKIKMIENSIENSWKGIYELKERIAGLSVTDQPKQKLVGDLIHPGDFVLLVTPIDKAAPK